MWRIRKLFYGLLLALIGAALLGAYGVPSYSKWKVRPAKYEDIEDHDYLPNVQRLVEEGHYDTALVVIDYVATQSGIKNRLRLIDMRKEIVELKARDESKVNRAIEAFKTGEANGVSGHASAIIADLVGWGDIRDCWSEGRKALRGEEHDTFLLVLSSAGLITSLSSITLVGAPAEAAITTLKFLKRIDGLSDEFVEVMGKQFKVAAESGEFSDSLLKGMEDLLYVSKSAPKGTAAKMIRQAKTPQDLNRLKIALEAAPNETVVLFEVAGPNAMKVLRTLDPNFDGAKEWRALLRKGQDALHLIGLYRLAIDKPELKSDPLNVSRAWLVQRTQLRRYILAVGSFFVGLAAWNILYALFGRPHQASPKPV